MVNRFVPAVAAHDPLIPVPTWLQRWVQREYPHKGHGDLLSQLAPIRLDYGIPIKADEWNDSGGRFNFTLGYRF